MLSLFLFIFSIYHYELGLDRWGRPLLIFDNTVQNTASVDDQMLFLGWNLEFAIKQMPKYVDKYVIFMVSCCKLRICCHNISPFFLAFEQF